MMDRSVLQRQMFAQGGPVYMQEGGLPAIAAEQQPDPQALEQMLTQASQNMGDIEEAGSYEEMINMMRDDNASMEDRRDELADLVGPEDAAQTPESVLALVQPVLQLAKLDQGIGELAAQEMTQPVEGDMAGGIMSNVAPAPESMGAGQQPPVNFNQGGVVRPVQYFAPENPERVAGGGPFAAAPGRLGELARERMAIRQNLLGDTSGRMQEQKDLTQAQMLFDLANTALAFAGPMPNERKGMSPAERLALAAQNTQLLPTIGARAAKLGEYKAGLDKEKQALQLAALGSAETALAAETKAAADAALEAQKAKARAVENALDRSADLNKILLQGTVDMEMAETKENWRAAAQERTIFAEKQAAELLASNNLIAMQKGKELQKNIDISKMLLESELTLDRLGVEDAYKLNQLKVGHDYATKLQEARLVVERARDANNVALKIADQEIEEAKMLQTAERDAAKARAEQKKIALEQEKLDLEKAAKGLETFGAQGKNKAQSVLANTALLEGYAQGTLNEAQTLMVNNAIDMLSTRDTIIQDGQAVQTGGNIPEAARQAVIARSKLPAEEGQSRLMPRDLKRITASPREFGDAVSKIMSRVPDATVAFGSDAAVRNVVNIAVEAASFGLASAPYEETEKAISAVEQLNLDTLTHFQQIKELRDSVALMKKLENQTANPKEFLTGDSRAKNKTATVLDTVDELISVLDLKIENMTDVDELNKANLAKQKALQLRAGFEAINNAYARIGSGGRNTTPEIERQQDAILFGRTS